MHFYYYQRRKTEEAKRVKRAQRLMRGTHGRHVERDGPMLWSGVFWVRLERFRGGGGQGGGGGGFWSADSALAAELPENLEK
jgi:hypothetical protein